MNMDPTLAPITPEIAEELPPAKSIDWLFVILQIGHRAVSLSVFVVIIALAAIKTKYLEPRPLAQVSFILADIGCLCAVGGWYFAIVRHKPLRESLGLLIFSLLIAGASLAALIHTRS